jgi:hypothetical protein
LVCIDANLAVAKIWMTGRGLRPCTPAGPATLYFFFRNLIRSFALQKSLIAWLDWHRCELGCRQDLDDGQGAAPLHPCRTCYSLLLFQKFDSLFCFAKVAHRLPVALPNLLGVIWEGGQLPSA